MRIIYLIAAVLLWSSAGAWADVGMITQISGQVSIATGGGMQAAVPFFKVTTGDKLTLANGSRVQIVYFGNGRQEVWKDSGQVEVGSVESKSTAKPELSQLPPLIVSQLAKTPAAGQQGRVGMMRVRSGGNAETAQHLNNQYADLKKSVPADDTTPEVFLLSGLIEIKEFARAREVLASLGGKPMYKAVVDHFSLVIAAVESK